MRRGQAPVLVIVMTIILFASGATLAFCQADTHVVASIAVQIEGTTAEWALRSFAGIRDGMLFHSAAAFTEYLSALRSRLVDERVFKSVEISDVADDPIGGTVAHHVTIHVVDAPTIAPLPDISYDSNQGLELGGQVTYGNAFGTMTDWLIDASVILSPAGPLAVNQWDANAQAANVMIAGLSWTAQGEVKREMSDLWDGATRVSAWEDNAATLSLKARLPLGGLLYYELAPGFAAQLDTLDLAGNGAEPPDFAGLNYRQAIGVGRVDWVGDFRTGYELRLEHFIQALGDTGGSGIANEVSVTATYYVPWSFLNYYARARAQMNWGRTPVDLGKDLRGIANDTMSGPVSAFLNQTLAIDLGLPRRVFDLQVQPFFDLGTAIPVGRGWEADRDLRAGTGAELVVFSDLLSGIFLRCTVGIDLGSQNPFASPEVEFDTTMNY